MRKLVYLFLAVALSFSLFSSCTKADEPFKLTGKVFAAEAYHSSSLDVSGLHFDGYDAYYVYRFTSETTAERSTRKNSPTGSIIGDIEQCTVSLNYPNITIKYTEYSTDHTENGTFLDEKTFRVVGAKTTYEYTLQ